MAVNALNHSHSSGGGDDGSDDGSDGGDDGGSQSTDRVRGTYSERSQTEREGERLWDVSVHQKKALSGDCHTQEEWGPAEAEGRAGQRGTMLTTIL